METALAAKPRIYAMLNKLYMHIYSFKFMTNDYNLIRVLFIYIFPGVNSSERFITYFQRDSKYTKGKFKLSMQVENKLTTR